MHFCKDNKSPTHLGISPCFPHEESKTSINILETIIEHIKNIEKSLTEIMQQSIKIQNSINKNYESLISTDLEKNNELILKIYSQGKSHIEEIEKIIMNYKNYHRKECSELTRASIGKNNLGNNLQNKLNYSNDIKEIKNYYEGKINIMDKKIKVFEILENLYLRQIDELKIKLGKVPTKKLKKINEDLIVQDFNFN